MKLPSPALSFRSPRPVRKFAENFSTTDMDISSITNMISALRASTAPDSITPEGLGSILQHIANLIGALSQTDVSTETNLIARVSAAEGNAATALQTAQGAAAAAAANVIDTFSCTQDSSTVLMMTLKQHGHNAFTVSLPGATTSYAGLMTALDKTYLNGAYNKRLKQLTTTSTDETVVLNYKCEDDTVKHLTFVGATSLTAGLMTAADKVKLDALDTAMTTMQRTAINLGTNKADLESNAPLSMLALSQWPRQIIKSITPSFPSEEGEISLMTGMLPSDPVELQTKVGNTIYGLGQPNEHVVYLARDTKKFYIWDSSQQTMVEVGGSGNMSIEIDNNYVTLQSNG